jgi:hypothetical protein
MGHVAQSWIGNGPNQPVSPQQSFSRHWALVQLLLALEKTFKQKILNFGELFLALLSIDILAWYCFMSAPGH